MSARDSRLLTAINQALRRARDAGSLVTGSGLQEQCEIAHTALRHIQGCENRGLRVQDFDGRGMRMRTREQDRVLDDLAKSLLAKLASDPERTAQRTLDCRKLAEILLGAYAMVPPEPPPVPADPTPADPAPADPAPTNDPADVV